MVEQHRYGEINLQVLSAMGLAEVVYIKPVTEAGRSVYAVHSADGRPLALLDSREAAIAVALSNDMQPLSVH